MAEEIGFENGRNSNFEGLVTLTLTLDPAIRQNVRALLIDLYLHTKFHWNRRNFLWTDGRTDVRTDIFPPLILLGRLLEVDLINEYEWMFVYIVYILIFTVAMLFNVSIIGLQHIVGQRNPHALFKRTFWCCFPFSNRLASHWLHVTDISGSPRTGSRPRRPMLFSGI